MSEEKRVLTDDEIDAIGEVMNMSMGSAATAVSTMLDRQVIISTPSIKQDIFSQMDYRDLDPAIVVRVKYVKGIDGESVVVFKRRDMQVILGLLMGGEINTDEDFEFDDFSMSAACEVMNQMMGASATALSKILETTIDISTPDAYLATGEKLAESAFEDNSYDPNENVVSISFNMEIKELLNTTFSSIMTPKLAQEIVDNVYRLNTVDPNIGVHSAAPQEPMQAAPAPEAVQAAPAAEAAPAAASAPAQQPQAPAQPRPQAPVQQAPAQQAVPAAPPVQQPMQQPMPQYYPQQQAYAQPPMGYPVQGYGQPPMGYPPYPQQQMYSQPPVNMHSAEFPEFRASGAEMPMTDANMGLLMNVKLDVSVVIGNTKRKIKDILDFGQGTVVELDKQTGAPADIVVNGQLIAKGDIMVVGDNFGVRITELTGTKGLMDSLGSNV